MIICPKCGNEVNEDDFCSKCGSSLKINTSRKNVRFCPTCGFGNTTRDNFCQKCGASLNSKSSNNKLYVPDIKFLPFILGIVSVLILLFSASKILFIICLCAFGFLFGFRHEKWFINSILVAVIPAIFFIVLIPHVSYVLMSIVPSILGGYIGYYLKEKRYV